MSEPLKAASPIPMANKPAAGPPESPTTARALDFDSDHDAEHTTPNVSEPIPRPPPKDTSTGARPLRNLSPREQSEMTLREAFPTVDASVIKAILIASGGSIEPAFNALLAMTDPDAVKQERTAPPALPTRPVRTPSAAEQQQLDADEMYARQLAEHYSGTGAGAGAGEGDYESPPRERRRSSNRYNENLMGSRHPQGRPGGKPNPDNVHWRSFFDDELPEIKKNIQQGFVETQTAVNGWLNNFRKRMDNEDDDHYDTSPPPPQPPRPNQQTNYGGQQQQQQQQQQSYGRYSNDTNRRSTDMQKYDADPQLIGEDFSKLGLRDGEAPPRTSSRPLANPNLFRADSYGRKSPGPPKKVTFQDVTTPDLYSGPNKPTYPFPQTTGTTPPMSSSPGRQSKWQPMSNVQPSPVQDNDPFSLGDSDDERDAKVIVMKDEETDNKKPKPPAVPTKPAEMTDIPIK